MSSLAELPDDPAVLKELVRERDERIADLQQRLRILLQKQFGRSSEKLDPSQLQLFKDLEEDVLADAKDEAKSDRRRRRRSRRRNQGGRQQLPENLPRHDVLHDVPEEERVCKGCANPMKRIGEDVSEQLEREILFYVLRRIRVKYACRECQEGVVVAEKPPQLIEKGLPGPGLLAQVIAGKYGYHLPLNRQAQMFACEGVRLSRSTLCDWVAAFCESSEVKRLYGYMKTEVLASKKIHSDDTIVPVLEEGRGQTRNGRLWAYVGDAWHPHVIFDYTPTREGQGPIDFLGWAQPGENGEPPPGAFRGYFQSDAYSGLDQLYAVAAGLIVEVACWAHARRKFVEARATNKRRADEIIALIQKLYWVERHARKLTPEQRKELRWRRSRSILAKIFRWIRANSRAVLPKSPLGKAIGYVRRQRRALTRFLEDGSLEIDNNAAERALRGAVVGRKNWMFAGSHQGARRAAIALTLVESAKTAGIDPIAYLKDLIQRLPTHPASRIAELTPAGWKAARAAAPGPPDTG